jgi:putative membrane protein
MWISSSYLQQPNPFHLSPLGDQMAGAVVMWFAAFLVPAVFVTTRLLQQNKTSKVAFS